MAWFIFFTSAIVIVIAGTQLARYGDIISDKTKLGGVWIGALLLAGATSLPEVLTDVNAVLIDAPDLAVGDIFGSSMTNILILAIIDLVHRQRKILGAVTMGQTVAALLALLLTAMACLFIAVSIPGKIGWIGYSTIVLAGIYILGMYILYRYEKVHGVKIVSERPVEEEQPLSKYDKITLRHAMTGFGMAALAIFIAAPFLARSAHDIAVITGMGETFVGSSLLAISTSLPELVSTLAAVRLGAFDMAVGNLFGSNAFNIFALFISDLFYFKGPLLNSVGQGQIVAGLAGIILMVIALLGIVSRVEKRYWLIELDSLAILVAYGAGMFFIWKVSSGGF